MDKSARLNQIINRLVHSTDPVETQALYKEWATTYDDDLEGFGYLAPKIGATLFTEAFPQRESLILDAGCGTGLVGKALTDLGYGPLHGVDFSPDMLAAAEQSGHYTRLMEASFLEPAFLQPLGIADETYDGIVCIGVYKSQMQTTLLPELIRCIKPGGILCLSARLHHVEAELDAQLKGYVEAGILKVESATQQAYMQAQNVDAGYFVLRK